MRVCVPASRRCPSGASGQRGEVTAELAIASPLLILAIIGLLQLALWLHAVNIALAAAQEAARAARVSTGSHQAGHQTARRYLAQLGPHLQDLHIQVTRTATVTRVEITARTQAVVFGLGLPVRAVAESPTERLTLKRPDPVRDPARLVLTLAQPPVGSSNHDPHPPPPMR